MLAHPSLHCFFKNGNLPKFENSHSESLDTLAVGNNRLLRLVTTDPADLFVLTIDVSCGEIGRLREQLLWNFREHDAELEIFVENFCRENFLPPVAPRLISKELRSQLTKSAEIEKNFLSVVCFFEEFEGLPATANPLFIFDLLIDVKVGDFIINDRLKWNVAASTGVLWETASCLVDDLGFSAPAASTLTIFASLWRQVQIHKKNIATLLSDVQNLMTEHCWTLEGVAGQEVDTDVQKLVKELKKSVVQYLKASCVVKADSYFNRVKQPRPADINDKNELRFLPLSKSASTSSAAARSDGQIVTQRCDHHGRNRFGGSRVDFTASDDQVVGGCETRPSRNRSSGEEREERVHAEIFNKVAGDSLGKNESDTRSNTDGIEVTKLDTEDGLGINNNDMSTPQHSNKNEESMANRTAQDMDTQLQGEENMEDYVDDNREKPRRTPRMSSHHDDESYHRDDESYHRGDETDGETFESVRCTVGISSTGKRHTPGWRKRLRLAIVDKDGTDGTTTAADFILDGARSRVSVQPMEMKSISEKSNFHYGNGLVNSNNTVFDGWSGIRHLKKRRIIMLHDHRRLLDWLGSLEKFIENPTNDNAEESLLSSNTAAEDNGNCDKPVNSNSSKTSSSENEMVQLRMELELLVEAVKAQIEAKFYRKLNISSTTGRHTAAHRRSDDSTHVPPTCVATVDCERASRISSKALSILRLVDRVVPLCSQGSFSKVYFGGLRVLQKTVTQPSKEPLSSIMSGTDATATLERPSTFNSASLSDAAANCRGAGDLYDVTAARSILQNTAATTADPLLPTAARSRRTPGLLLKSCWSMNGDGVLRLGPTIKSKAFVESSEEQQQTHIQQQQQSDYNSYRQRYTRSSRRTTSFSSYIDHAPAFSSAVNIDEWQAPKVKRMQVLKRDAHGRFISGGKPDSA